MKQMIWWLWWRTWHALYGRRRQWARSVHFDGRGHSEVKWDLDKREWIFFQNGDAVVGYSAWRSGEGLRWFWRRNVEGIETLGR